ncbi:MAG: hypothetical protein A3F95_00095 [Candidatus Nealsonbacteria bacterium RIFCSPLOWO2_12_FULL_39_31]|uniref:Uncharacterized protein n=1 Tax=Candidatus Nealsonbacteria bacterium RIFCSPLOWO2_12_FULL_39_31 TaxID=1801676 RepID=A0A1G2EKD4_9BACT|nr:MAG: hypothetical protein A3F95_00095 [Candidatus Nealsonbacteria bacterium RIFCSPLOWO2_12_FULL_39_31]
MTINGGGEIILRNKGLKLSAYKLIIKYEKNNHWNSSHLADEALKEDIQKSIAEKFAQVAGLEFEEKDWI